MSKQESTILKGIAILMMFFLHLFNSIENSSLCINFCTIGETPLVTILSRATSPVPLFLILGGYGMYISHQKGHYNIFFKVKSLYIHYWITLLIFIPILFNVKHVSGGFFDTLQNVTAFNTTWNGEVWFLFPYVLIMASSKWLVQLICKRSFKHVLLITFILSMASGYVVSSFGSQWLYSNRTLHQPIIFLSFLFPFSIGAYMAKWSLHNKDDNNFMISKWIKPVVGGGNFEGLWIWLMLIVLVAFRCCFRTGAFHTLYVALFILLFVNAPRPKKLDAFLLELGRRSTSMWFVHTYFCYYLFHDWIYGFRYPVLIFIVLLACSYGSAVVIDWINARVQKVVLKRNI